MEAANCGTFKLLTKNAPGPRAKFRAPNYKKHECQIISTKYYPLSCPMNIGDKRGTPGSAP